MRSDTELLDFMMKHYETQQFGEHFSTQTLTRETLDAFIATEVEEEWNKPE